MAVPYSRVRRPFWAVLLTLVETGDELVTRTRHDISRATFYRYASEYEAYGVRFQRPRSKNAPFTVLNWQDVEKDVLFLAGIEATGRLPSATRTFKASVTPSSQRLRGKVAA
jgi:hypothetical protein